MTSLERKLEPTPERRAFPATVRPPRRRIGRAGGRGLAWLALPLLFGCPRPAPVESSGPSDTAGASAVPDGETALERVSRMIDAARIQGTASTREEDLARAAAVGLVEDEILRTLAELLADCLAATEACEDFAVSGGMLARPDRYVLELLLTLLGESGTPAALPLLLRLDARHVWRAGLTLERILERAWTAGRAEHPPAPPTAEQVAAVRAGLGGFGVLRIRDGAFVAEAATDAELDDLAYFLAAVCDAGAEVGVFEEAGRGSFARPGEPDPARENLARALDEAKHAGDLGAVVRTGVAYLESLGYPGPIRTEEESSYAWGGASWSYAMRDVARAAEATGDFGLAEALYRRARPGGGACGTSVDYRWQRQVEGAIRAAELAGRPNAAVAERLIAVDGDAGSWRGTDYGPRTLADAGFDVARLYRGALVTANRDAPAEELEAALRAVPAALAGPALERLAARGPEAWDRRVWAVEGLADASGREAVPALFELLATGRTAVRVRALRALGAAAERPYGDPCVLRGFGFGEGSSEWARAIAPFGHDCETVITLAETDALAARLHPLLEDPEPDVRAAAAEALGRIASPTSRERLQRVADADPDDPDAGERCRTVSDESGATRDECTPYQPVREAAREALERLDRVEAAWARQAAEAAGAASSTP
ncbi:MAG: HEAT repeat domain-containing protein [Deltaproteobacteria bacterium]|nr:HEAT repeat domain-containing protein [Deltaproteobacteria bacterium]